MDTRRAFLVPVVLILLLLIFTAPAASKPTDAITVNGADAIRQASVSVSQDLLDSTASVGPRILLQYANHLCHVGLAAMPGALQTYLGQVTDRIVVEFANATRHDDLAAMPGALGTLMGLVPDRIVFQYANHNSEEEMVYPLALFDDATPPQVSEVSASGSEGIITWTTDEFANSTVRYGIQTGVYTGTVSDPLYVKLHEIVLPELASGMTYYYQVSSTDRSGNTVTSSENSFSSQESIYLPLVLRQ